MSLGPLVTEANLGATLRSIYKYNHKRTLVTHDNTERTFALNDEAATVICDYGTASTPSFHFRILPKSWQDSSIQPQL